MEHGTSMLWKRFFKALVLLPSTVNRLPYTKTWQFFNMERGTWNMEPR
jgi:hypothetical protein